MKMLTYSPARDILRLAGREAHTFEEEAMRVDRLTGLVALGVVLSGCGGGEEAETSEVVVDSAVTSAAPAAEGPTDPQIAAIVVAANNVDIAAGEVAAEKGTDAEVKAFGQQMVTDHSAVNQQATELVTRLAVTPEENPTSQQLTSDGEAARARIGALSGAEFDRAYIDHEVTYHQTLLDAIDQTLIPSADNAELRTLLEQTRPAVVAHLEHARQIQTRLTAQ
jgi:putative membrane protein